MPPRKTPLTPKEKAFCVAYLKNYRNVKKAMIEVGYSETTADKNGYAMMGKSGVQEEISRIERLIESESVSSLLERRQTLTEIHRGRMSNFGTAGADGFIPDVGPENLNNAALSEITTRVEVDKAATGGSGTVAFITKVKLESKTAAIDLLNKMDGIYLDKSDSDSRPPVNFIFNIGGEQQQPKQVRGTSTRVEMAGDGKLKFAIKTPTAKSNTLPVHKPNGNGNGNGKH